MSSGCVSVGKHTPRWNRGSTVGARRWTSSSASGPARCWGRLSGSWTRRLGGCSSGNRAGAARSGQTRGQRETERIVVERGYKNLRLNHENVAEFDYRPVSCKKTYRLVVMRRNISRMKGGLTLFDESNGLRRPGAPQCVRCLALLRAWYSHPLLDGGLVLSAGQVQAWNSKLAFEFLVLTATRDDEVRGAASTVIELNHGVWTIPTPGTKTNREHRVPLAGRALEILGEAKALDRGSLLVLPMRGENRSPTQRCPDYPRGSGSRRSNMASGRLFGTGPPRKPATPARRRSHTWSVTKSRPHTGAQTCSSGSGSWTIGPGRSPTSVHPRRPRRSALRRWRRAATYLVLGRDHASQTVPLYERPWDKSPEVRLYKA